MSPLISDPFITLVNAAASERDSKPSESKGHLRTPSATPPLLFDNASPSPMRVTATLPKVSKCSFAETLMDLLFDDEYSEIVTFLPDGLSFGIINAKVFADEVMPKVLGIRTFSSFVRKLHRWGFERILEKKTHDVDVFRHHLFRKGDWASCRKISCGGRQRHHEIKAPEVILSPSLTARQQENHGSKFFASPTIPPLTPSWSIPSIHDVTSQVVGAALQALKRDEEVHAPTDFQQILMYPHMQARLMALRQRQLLGFGVSPNLSMVMM
jgi:hypothetical protein